MRLIGSQNKSGDIRIIVASKDSMTPEIQPDDLLFVDTSVRSYVGESVYILLHGGELVCKRLSLVGRTLTVSSDNKAYPSWPWDEKPDETSIIGKVLRALPMTFKKFGSV
jgi:phage repressor protein C with HTH and peptisase S24 domain